MIMSNENVQVNSNQVQATKTYVEKQQKNLVEIVTVPPLSVSSESLEENKVSKLEENYQNESQTLKN